MIGKWLSAALCTTVLTALLAGSSAAQIPGRGRFPSQPSQPIRRDSTKDSTAKSPFPAPDSVTERLLRTPGYSVTRYAGDTAFFNANQKSLDLLAGKKRNAAVERDSNRVVSDSGIYYTEASRQVVTGGIYIVTPPPSTGQSEIHGHGYLNYNLAQRSVLITNASLPVNNGEMWYMSVNRAVVFLDSTGAKNSTTYIGGGQMTSCDDSVPDYEFTYKEAKRIGNTIVARPAVLKIKDVPVMWFPFIFTDQRPGRHSGILAPQFGVGDIIRNSPSYRRNVDHVGYYWALSDYMGFATWLDWRSSANSTTADPGYLRYNADWDYKWIDRFLGGRVGMNYTDQRDGQTNLAISWNHQEDFGRNNHLNTNFNYVTSTTLQRQNTFNPYTALATIASAASYQSKIGPASLTIGATRKQYPGRQQVDQGIPSISLTTSPIAIGDKFSWTPNFSYTRSDVLHMDQPGLGAYGYFTRDTTVNGIPTQKIDSALGFHRNSANDALSFDTPIQIFGWDFRQSFHLEHERNNFPQQFTIYDVTTGAITGQRVYAATYQGKFDWVPEFQLPAIGHNRLNLTPSFSLQNIDPGPLMVASERTGGNYVLQGTNLLTSKRPTFGVSMSPTLYAFFFNGGLGPFSRVRHSITPSLTYSTAPSATVTDEYLIATGRTRKGYLGSLRQSSITLGLNQNFEAKIKKPTEPNDSASVEGQNGTNVRLLSINTTPLSYDFVRRAHADSMGIHSWTAGLTTESFTYSLSSDLLPGFDFSSTYSLFTASTLSDTARFSPYLTGISASFNLSRDENPWTKLTRLFGKAVPNSQAAPTTGVQGVRPQPPQDAAMEQAIAAQPVAGSARGGDRFITPPTQGWRASISFSRSSPRPPSGSNVIDFDPRTRCAEQVGSDPFLLDACLASIRAQPTTDLPVTSATAGGPLYKIPPTTSINSNISFNLTPKWAAQWTTTYDLEAHEFASHMVSLQRDLHDWRAIFGFTQSPNGNFAFNFSIALKADPDIKADYNRATVRSGIY